MGAVILEDPTAPWCAELTDSKKLSPRHRETLSTAIRQKALAVATGWVMIEELNQIGLTEGLRLATRRAVEAIQAQKVPFHEIIIDGNTNFLSDTPLEPHTTTCVKGDLTIKEISAASIIAKVARDHYMIELATKYPGYDFEHHVGYGTPAHRAALGRLGPCPEHRTFIRPIRNFLIVNPQLLGQDMSEAAIAARETPGARAEAVVAAHLAARGHHILARNARSKYYEIDIVSTVGDQVFFTEVKYRSTAAHGTPLEAITPKKLQQMQFAARSYFKRHKTIQHLQPILAAAAVSGPDFHLDDWFPII